MHPLPASVVPCGAGGPPALALRFRRWAPRSSLRIPRLPARHAQPLEIAVWLRGHISHEHGAGAYLLRAAGRFTGAARCRRPVHRCCAPPPAGSPPLRAATTPAGPCSGICPAGLLRDLGATRPACTAAPKAGTGKNNCRSSVKVVDAGPAPPVRRVSQLLLSITGLLRTAYAAAAPDSVRPS